MAAVRPAMHTRDASGRQVSLLNDEPGRLGFDAAADMGRADSYASTGSGSSPRTPDLLRANSYDSQTSNGPQSPSTPSSLDDFAARPSSYAAASAYPDPTLLDNNSRCGPVYYAGYTEQKRFNHNHNHSHSSTHSNHSLPAVRPAYERPSSFDAADAYTSTPLSDRSAAAAAAGGAAGKRYPCRFKDTHGCDKTFTTSGHASRHSKIHTAEKAVHCSFAGCCKKFTRADNMKQHLETHYKERSRASAASSSASSSSSLPKLTVPAGIVKKSSGGAAAASGRASRPGSRNMQRPSLRTSSLDSYAAAASASAAAAYYSPLASPMSSAHEPLDMAHFQRSLPPHMHSRTASSDSYALDTLAALCSSDSL